VLNYNESLAPYFTCLYIAELATSRNNATPVTLFNEEQFHILQVIPFSKYLLYQTMARLQLNYRMTLEQSFQTLSTHFTENLVTSQNNVQTASKANETHPYKV
jgi:DNA integrity scanning protein DisA with diadenylate cyclase activity